MRNKVNFEIVSKTDEVLYIADLFDESDPTMTITNGAEEVVDRLLASGDLDGKRRLFYKDTDGAIDELMYLKSGFRGFRAGDPAIVETLRRIK